MYSKESTNTYSTQKNPSGLFCVFGKMNFRKVSAFFLAFLIVVSFTFSLLGNTVNAQGEGPELPPSSSSSGSDSKVEPQGCFGLTISGGVYFNMEVCISEGAEVLMRLAGFTVWVSGKLLDGAIDQTIHFKQFTDNIPLVSIGWVIFRDLANITFIFILLWISIATIVGISSVDTKRLLVKLVLFALLINFSLFITKAVIDASNIITIHFYDLMTLPGGDATKDRTSISAVFMDGLKLNTAYDIKKLNSTATPEGDSLDPETRQALNKASNGSNINVINILLISVGSIALFLVTAFVFTATSLMFLGRAVALMFLMILSPLAFVGFVLPGLSGGSQKWWKHLISQSFFAPAYMILVYVVVLTIHDSAFQDFLGNAAFSEVLTKGAGFQIIINFIIIIALMLGALMLAKSIGGKTSDLGMMVAGKARSLMGGAGGYVGRSIIRSNLADLPNFAPKIAQNMLNSKILSPIMPKKGGELHSRLQKFANKKVEGEYSLRRLDEKFGESRLSKTALGDSLRRNTTNALVNMKMGGHSVQEAHAKDKGLEEARDSLDKRDAVMKAIKDAKVRNAEIDATSPSMEKEIKERKEVIKALRELIKAKKKDPARKDEVENAQKTLALARKDLAFVEKIKLEAEAEKEEMKGKIQQNMARLSPKEFVKYLPENDFYDPNVMRHANSAQIKALMEDKERGLNETDKTKGLEAHFSELIDGLKDVKDKEGEYMEALKIWEDNKGVDPKTGEEISKPKKPTLDTKIYDDMRNYTTDQLSLILSLPEKKYEDVFFKNPAFNASLRWGQIDDIRKDPRWGRNLKDTIRTQKDQGALDAIYMDLGIDLTLPENEKEVLRNIRKEMPFEEILESLDSEEEKEKAQFLHDQASEAMEEHVLNRTATEISKMRGRFLKSNIAIRSLDQGHMKAIQKADKDQADVAKIVKKIAEDFNRTLGIADSKLGIASDLDEAEKQRLRADREGKNFIEILSSISDPAEKTKTQKIHDGIFESSDAKLGIASDLDEVEKQKLRTDAKLGIAPDLDEVEKQKLRTERDGKTFAEILKSISDSKEKIKARKLHEDASNPLNLITIENLHAINWMITDREGKTAFGRAMKNASGEPLALPKDEASYKEALSRIKNLTGTGSDSTPPPAPPTPPVPPPPPPPSSGPTIIPGSKYGPIRQ